MKKKGNYWCHQMSLITSTDGWFLTKICGHIDDEEMWQNFELHHFFCSIRGNIATRT